MHNINYIRQNPTEFDNFMKIRGENPIANKINNVVDKPGYFENIMNKALSIF